MRDSIHLTVLMSVSLRLRSRATPRYHRSGVYLSYRYGHVYSHRLMDEPTKDIEVSNPSSFIGGAL